MVVAPIFAPTVNGSIEHSVWIPPGGWVRWQTGELHVGPRVMTQEFTQEEIPVFVRAGAVIPLKTMEAVHELAPRVLVLQIVLPGNGAAAAGNTTVYEDDGVSMEYQDAEAFRTMDVTQTSNSSCTDVTISPHSGGAGYAGELHCEVLQPGVEVMGAFLQASKGKPIDEQDELVRLQKILEKHGVRLEIRQPLADSLVLWKHDEDQK